MTAFQEGQFTQLQNLIESVIATNTFYRRKFRAAGITGPPKSFADFFDRWPFTEKQALMEDQTADPPYGTNLTFPLTHYNRFHQTSGTSGKPLRWLDTAVSWNWMKGNWRKVLTTAGVQPGDAILFAFSFGPFLGFWTAFEAAADMGCRCVPGGGLSTLARLRIIEENRIKVLCCTPTYALRLGEIAAEDGPDLNLDSVDTLIVAGEPGGGIPEIREKILASWPGAQLFDHHGMTEVGPVSYTTAEQPNLLRIIEDSYIAEIIDPATLQPVPPGQSGELVLTTLGRLGSPLIRYRTGDLVQGDDSQGELWAPYRLQGGILGRIDDMITVRGVNVYPSAIERIVRRLEDIGEFRVIIETERNMTEMRVQIEAAPGAKSPDKLPGILADELKSTLALRIPVERVPYDTLPRFAMKAKRWLVRT